MFEILWACWNMQSAGGMRSVAAEDIGASSDGTVTDAAGDVHSSGESGGAADDSFSSDTEPY